jgi:hypothetical protein
LPVAVLRPQVDGEGSVWSYARCQTLPLE